MFSDKDKDFIHGIFIVIFMVLIVFLIVQFNKVKSEALETKELKNVAIKIEQNFRELQSKKDMSCFFIVESSIETKKVSLYLDENMSQVSCSEQIEQFKNYAMREPFTLEVIEYP